MLYYTLFYYSFIIRKMCGHVFFASEFKFFEPQKKDNKTNPFRKKTVC
tara:strand:+ start:62 stop:205 length:144 start_codon:yes stop_codon:yes gene_type:complete